MPTSQNGQALLNNSSAVGDELFECVWPFCGVDASKVNHQLIETVLSVTTLTNAG